MIQSTPSFKPSARPAALRLYRPQSPAVMSARWLINGYSARLFVWTVEEWEGLEERPSDAQYHALGFWCALQARMRRASQGFAFAGTVRGRSLSNTSVPRGGTCSGSAEKTRSASLAELANGRSRIELPKLATVIRSPSSAA